ncbi:ABC transporter substrate-binding protein [Nostoc sp. FACHB-110]|uniref:ABC transporter substrate-binding protein n=1 Tax=Nostoc sp. FACHB-110 TaxID=2692834 RepID=UPI001686F393|nr:ABC transporter substrate-binding protein [Nostoc sp. FACHB-110]MBD2438986.1 ABC transporter substrate-binding protein [Nostoc sp. FACHB-110]
MNKDSIARKNPYIIGRPIEAHEPLFGRENIFQFIHDNLKQDIKVLFLYGQLRIGLSSIISNIPKYINYEFIFIKFDVQEHSQESFNDLLQSLIEDIITQLNIDTNFIKLPLISSLENETELFYDQFIHQINQYLQNKKIVLIIKEFCINHQISNNLAIKKFFDFLYFLIQNQDNIFVIFFVSGTLKDQSYLTKLFNNAPYQEVGLLDEQSAEKLIINPAKGILEYEQDAVTAILELSAGHPYFIQVICFTIFVEARIENNWKVTRADVEVIVDKAIESAEAGLAWLWDGMSIPERVILSAVAEAQKKALEKKLTFPEDPLELLEKRGVAKTKTDELIQSVPELVNKGLLDETKRRVKIELVRRWLVQRHPLQTEILELELLKPKPDNFDKEITEIKHHTNYLYRKQSWLILSILLFSTGIIVGIILTISMNKFSSPCPAGQQKENGICHQPGNNFTSSGERTLFPTTYNSDRDKGIEAFKQGKYDEAIAYFAQAVQKNRNDPEVLIYYNNALARQQSNPLTVAVAVPINNQQNIAQEMLRGVALAQKECNANRGLNRRLLEIVIANDADEPTQAKKVAQQLIQDQSVLAVIGHYSSAVTQAALDEYKRANPPLAIISPTSASSTIKDDKIFFRATPSTSLVGEILAKHIKDKLKLQKTVIFYNPNDPYSNDLREKFTNKFKEIGGELVGSPINLAQPNLDPEQKLNQVVSQYQPQAAMLFTAPKATGVALEIIQAKDKSNNPLVKNLKFFSGGNFYSNDLLNKGGKAVEGLVLTSPWFKDSAQSKNFAVKAKQQWGGDVSYRTATSYDATQAVIKALSPDSSRTTVLRNLPQVNLVPQETSGNEIKFIDGEIPTKPILIEVKDGKFQLLK